MPELRLCLRSSPALAGCITHPAPKVRSLLCVIIFMGMNRRGKRSFIECQVHLGVRVRVPIAAVESRNATEGARAESISRRATEKGSA